ncbi:alpha-ketoglutarate-dependent dioxygenase alkB homolog 7, mitochondrial [Nymphalis io]|uniref:alpha-ketoglutarate-dependent dioxygenase alkB homolog 7, mitochondrial n=1 Tax=Inachis io TaxID=171585 RepID=UPI0021691481|nr:alpha-ketoglutarate-dependent dioxygenase alkB homolog 7, mitochondrial [Nymphalis io]
MRFLTFSVLKNCKIKTSLFKNFSVQVQANREIEKLSDPNLVEILPSWKEDEEAELRATVLQHMRVLPNFVTEEEEAALLAEVEPQLKRMRYEFDHWDNAIEGYRETERSKWNATNSEVLARVRAVAFPPHAELLPHAHVLDLAPAGHIRPHVDAVRFCGDTIAGLCLLSSAVMRLTHEQRPHLALDALLQRRCLYVMTGVARYAFSHAVLRGAAGAGGAGGEWRGAPVRRRRRVAVICRERPAAPRDGPSSLPN